jgi:2-(1,2-epoxy-1,2-dihydrophenyl)acetyl-CoA isomerase
VIRFRPGTLTRMSWFDIDDRGPVRRLVLNRPEARNAIPADGWEALRQTFVDFEASDCRVLVIGGAGGAFCAGADVRGLEESTGMDDRRRRMARVGDAVLALHRLTKPTVAAVSGVAVGAGMNLALGCDLVIADQTARFSEIFVQRGLTLDAGGSWLLPRLVGLQRAKELALTGRIVEASEALELGLVLEVVEPGMLEARVDELAGVLAAGAPVAQMFSKQAIDRAMESSFEQALALEGQSQAICLSTADVAEGVAAFLGKRPPRFQGR